MNNYTNNNINNNTYTIIKIILIISILLNIILIGTMINQSKNSISKNDILNQIESYNNDIASKEAFYADLDHITIDQAFTIDSNEYYLYFYQATCGYCDEIKEDVYAFYNSDAEVYYVDLADPNNSSAWSEVGLTNNNPTNYEEIEISGTPTMLHFKDGAVINTASGTIEILDMISQ